MGEKSLGVKWSFGSSMLQQESMNDRAKTMSPLSSIGGAFRLSILTVNNPIRIMKSGGSIYAAVRIACRG